MSRLVLALLLLTATYALVLASVHPWDLALGAALSAGVLLAFRPFLLGRRPAPIDGLVARLLALPRLVWAVLADITVGTVRVAAVVLGLRPLESPGIVAVPVGDRTEAGVVVSAFAATLAPGEYLVDVDWSERRMLLHVLDARDPDGVRERFDHFYRRYQRRVVP